MSPHLTAVVQALFVAFLWATSWVLIKIGLGEIPALTFAGLRFTLAAMCLLPLALRPVHRTALRGLPAFGLPDPPLVAVGAYRGAPLRSLATGEPVIFVRWRADDDGEPDPYELCTALALAAHRAGGAIALVAPESARPATCPAIAARRVGPVDPPALVPSERLVAWRVGLR